MTAKKFCWWQKPRTQEYKPEYQARYIVLEDGHRYEGRPGLADFQITRFARHSIRIDRPSPDRPLDHETLDTLQLWNSQETKLQGELQMRLSAPLAVFLLAPLAALMAYTKPRQSRYGKFFVAILVYFVYNNLLKIKPKLGGKR